MTTTFNLKKFLEKVAAKSIEEQVIEAQLNNGRSESNPQSLTQKQLDSKRQGEVTQVTEAQLGNEGSVDQVNITESQLRSKHNRNESKTITQKQLDVQREGETDNLTEFQLNQVRKSGVSSTIKTAKTDAITEGKLRDIKPINGEPTTITQDQLKEQRKETPNSGIEANLEKVRTGAAETLTEHRLDHSKSKLVKHRNSKASAGDINKLEEQRLSKNTTESEEAKPSSQGRSIYDVKPSNNDSARLASALDFNIVKKKSDPLKTAGADDEVEQFFGEGGVERFFEDRGAVAEGDQTVVDTEKADEPDELDFAIKRSPFQFGKITKNNGPDEGFSRTVVINGGLLTHNGIYPDEESVKEALTDWILEYESPENRRRIDLNSITVDLSGITLSKGEGGHVVASGTGVATYFVGPHSERLDPMNMFQFLNPPPKPGEPPPDPNTPYRQEIKKNPKGGEYVENMLVFDAGDAQKAGLLEPEDIIKENQSGNERLITIKEFALQWIRGDSENRELAHDRTEGVQNLTLHGLKLNFRDVKVSPDGTMSGPAYIYYRVDIPSDRQRFYVKEDPNAREDRTLKPSFTMEKPIINVANDGTYILTRRLKFNMRQFYDVHDIENPEKTSVEGGDVFGGLLYVSPGKTDPEGISAFDIKEEARTFIAENDPLVPKKQGTMKGLGGKTLTYEEPVLGTKDLSIVHENGTPFKTTRHSVDLSDVKRAPQRFPNGKTYMTPFETAYVVYHIPISKEQAYRLDPSLMRQEIGNSGTEWQGMMVSD